MKKKNAISFIFLANLILLAHAVIPHHDHENMMICFCDTDCKNHNTSHSHADCDTQSHQENTCSDSTKCCNIDYVFDPTNHKVKSFCHKHSQCDCLHTSYILTSIFSDIQDFTNDTLFLFLYVPYIDASHSDYISQSLGLRAPPLYN